MTRKGEAQDSTSPNLFRFFRVFREQSFVDGAAATNDAAADTV
jgi:hypothetical protein